MTDPKPATTRGQRSRAVLLALRRAWVVMRVVVLTVLCGLAAAGVVALAVAALIVGLSGDS